MENANHNDVMVIGTMAIQDQDWSSSVFVWSSGDDNEGLDEV